MKETLDEQSRQDLIRYRIDRAKQTVEEAEGMLASSSTTLLSTDFIMPCFMQQKHYCWLSESELALMLV